MYSATSFPQPRAQVRFLSGAFPLEEPNLGSTTESWRFSRIDQAAPLGPVTRRFGPLYRGLREVRGLAEVSNRDRA